MPNDRWAVPWFSTTASDINNPELIVRMDVFTSKKVQKELLDFFALAVWEYAVGGQKQRSPHTGAEAGSLSPNKGPGCPFTLVFGGGQSQPRSLINGPNLGELGMQYPC